MLSSFNQRLSLPEDQEDHDLADLDANPAASSRDGGDTDRPPSPERLEAYLDQVLLRVFLASPGLASYIESSRVVPASGHVEVSFYKVPDEVVSAIVQAFGIPVEELRYTKNGAACYGFRAKPNKEDLSSLGVDDSDQEGGDDDPLDNESEDDADALAEPISAEVDALLSTPSTDR